MESGIIILVVDDDGDFRLMIKYGLKGRIKNLTIVEADDGEMALQVIARYHPVLVVSDLEMPRMNGAELFREIRHQFPGTHFILMSGLSRAEIKKSYHLDVSEIDFLWKPFFLPELEKLVRKKLGLPKQPSGNIGEGRG